jgi:HK97 family phage major capsid protein
MKVSTAMREWVVKNAGVAANASDSDVSGAIADALLANKLTPDEVNAMAKSASGAEDRVRQIVADEITKSVSPKFDAIMKAINGAAAATEGNVAANDQQQLDGKAAVGAIENKAAQTVGQKAFIAGAGTGVATMDDSGNVRVKSVVEQFDNTCTAATWDKSSKLHLQKAFGGRQLTTGEGEGECSRLLDMPNTRKRTIADTWLKCMIVGAFRERGIPVPGEFRLSELDRKMFDHITHECQFVGPINFNEKTDNASHWYTGQPLSEMHRKALLDSNGDPSGGFQAVPIEFDDLAIITPLLHGELFPYVKIQNVTHRQIQGFTIGNPSLSWGTAEGTEITPFNTDGFIGAFNNFIFPITGGMEIGLDFEADSPVGIGDMVTQRFGEAFLKAMDNVIVTGNGINQPFGIANTPAAPTALTLAGSPFAGQMNLTDYEALYLGIGKQYLEDARSTNSFAFISTQSNYRKAKGMPVSASDQRRVFGTDGYGNWTLADMRYAINESFSDNSTVIGACLNRYRLYRRQGYEVRIVTEGAELAKRNTRLIIVRARYGGRMELAGAMARVTSAPAA